MEKGKNMDSIVFFDTEIDPNTCKILDIGCVKEDGALFHSNSISGFIQFLNGSRFVCGHNIFHHDLKYVHHAIDDTGISCYIDTLFFSPLLFPARPYHRLLKDDKLQTEDVNNPLNDSMKARDLFFDEVNAFMQADKQSKQIYFSLLKDKIEFRSFFDFLGFSEKTDNVEEVIREKFQALLCVNADLSGIIREHPVELAYCLALIHAGSRYSITPPWVLKSFPAVERIMFLLKSNPCLSGCAYCNEALDIYKGLKRFFGFDSYRTYAGEPLQERAVGAAVAGKSLLAVFPTGGGKSITFQVPALMNGINAKGLTVVISPLQSLMKDQVDNLEKAGITEAVTVNGLLDPIERAKSLERVENGSASILYISPESLRSRTIEHLLLGRNVVRFVIDEAHCFSSWGQDFRVDYLYIGDFIKSLQEKKNLAERIPVSCFTATAKQMVIEDIQEYFRGKLNLELEVYRSDASRTNLHYQVIMKEDDEEKYNTVRDLLNERHCPAIVYVSRTRKAYALAQRLTEDGYAARPYHGKMDKQEKSLNQDAFMKGEVQIMVATSAFGMGVDKKDVGMVIHYEISDSLENYVQEAGRAGRDETVSADCYVLFNDEDLNKHFILLNQTKLSIREIRQVWKAIRDITRFRSKVSQSALEIARKAGWDDSFGEIESRVKAAISALEEAGYIKRGQNMPRIFADSILARNAWEATQKIYSSARLNDKQKKQAARIITKLFSCKSRIRSSDDGAESRVDYISDTLGMDKAEVIEIVNFLREERILADTKDLSAFMRKKESANHSLGIFHSYSRIEGFLKTALTDGEKIYHIKELNEEAQEAGCTDVTPYRIKTILNFWAIKNWIKRQNTDKDHVAILPLYTREGFEKKLIKRNDLAKFILEYLYGNIQIPPGEENREEIRVEFSVLELKEEFERRITLFQTKITADDVEDALFFLSKIEAIKIEGGFMVIYNAMSIERVEQDHKKRYKEKDYQKLEQYYENKVQQIHIVGEYAKKMIGDYKDALQFVDDYFQLNYSSFLNKYFKGSRKNEIKRNITPTKFMQLFGELSPAQLKIINDRKSKYIVVAAGPGSGKTRILVHKLASLVLMEDVKSDQMLMVTFSRSAATEFKKRLLKLIGNAANFIEIKTFHSYCFDLLGRIGTLEKSDKIIRETVRQITNGGTGKITKSVLVIDEAQDMDADEFALINALMEHNEDMRVVAVEDDDQNIYEFRGSSPEYLLKLIREKGAVLYELVENYRSKSNLVDFSNQFAQRISARLKTTPILAVQGDCGKIKIIRHKNGNLIRPVADGILSEGLAGTTCVLTKSNDEALQITGLLVKNGLQAKLIQTNEEFSLQNLVEVRFFLNRIKREEQTGMIDNDVWEDAKSELKDKYSASMNLEVCLTLMKNFEAVNPKNKFKTDFEIFIRESKLEDFFEEKLETVFVSTMHKAKGREFDNVFLMLDRFYMKGDADFRLLYVAMTRARKSLIIHYNGNYLDFIKTEGLDRSYDATVYQPPCQLAMKLLYRDVWLDFFQSCQDLISNLKGGDDLLVDGRWCCNEEGYKVLKFSRQGMNKIDSVRQNGYVPTKAKVSFLVYWKKENGENEMVIILPELYFDKQDSD